MPVVTPGIFGPGTTTRAAYGSGSNPTIYRVTNLSDSGAGSMRAAVETASGPRVVIFETSGTIVLSSDMYVNNPFVTIAGQTAPPPGITLKGFGLQCYTHDVLVQHIKSRPGDGPPLLPQTADHDASLVYSSNAYNVVWDHCSFSWAQDKLMTIGSIAGGGGVTVWGCLFSESLYHAAHVTIDANQPSSLGMLIKQTYVGVSADVGVFRSLFAHNSDRNPEIQGPLNVWWCNNVVYDWGRDLLTYSPGYPWATFLYHETFNVSIIGSVYISGGGSHPVTPLYAIYAYSVNSGSQLYIHDVIREQALASITEFGTNGYDPRVGTSPVSLSGMTMLDGVDTEDYVLATAGAFPAYRDGVDTRIASEVSGRTGTVIASQDDVGGWETQAVNTRALTTPENPHTYSGDYTNLEIWLHSYSSIAEGGTPAPPPDEPPGFTGRIFQPLSLDGVGARVG